MTLRILSILIVSNVGVVREGLHSVLARQGGVEVVGTVDLLHAQEHCAQTQPQIILFDAGHECSAEVVREIVASAPRSKVVAFGVREAEKDILALAAAGTAGYIRDNVKSSDIVGVLQQVLSDELTCSPRAAAYLYRCVGALSQHHNKSHADPAPLPLSRRELQVIDLIDHGLTNKEIGRRLGIEAATVKNHIHNICAKLNVHRRGEATARMRSILNGDSSPAAAPDSLPAPKQTRDRAPVADHDAATQNPAARNGNHVGQPWTNIGQPGGAVRVSAPSELRAPKLKL
jgi:DNA-binding NarL/FixJ family response regulator